MSTALHTASPAARILVAALDYQAPGTHQLFRANPRILADLGRHLNPVNWIFLQTLAGRGFDKSRIRVILNRNPASPQDFWVESIEQMFEMPVFAVIPNDYVSLDKLPRDRFEFPADTPFGKAITRLASRMVRTGSNGPHTGSQPKAA